MLLFNEKMNIIPIDKAQIVVVTILWAIRSLKRIKELPLLNIP